MHDIRNTHETTRPQNNKLPSEYKQIKMNQNTNRTGPAMAHGSDLPDPYIHMFIYLVCIGKTQKIWYHSTQNSKNGLDKIIGTLNLIFGSTPFGKNNWDQSLPVTISESLSPTAPGVSDLKGSLSQLVFWELSTGVLWDLDMDSLLVTSELSSALS